MLIYINFSFDFLDLKNIDFENYIVANEVIKLLHVLLEKNILIFIHLLDFRSRCIFFGIYFILLYIHY